MARRHSTKPCISVAPCSSRARADLNAINAHEQNAWNVTTEEQCRDHSFYAHTATEDLLEKLVAGMTLGEDLDPEFRQILNTRQVGRPNSTA
jgi:hypothetical protein